MERILRIGSVSGASFAKRLLSEAGIRTRLIKADVGADGCVWGLRIKDKDLHEVVRHLRMAGISYDIR
jgi:hypothetical protein